MKILKILLLFSLLTIPIGQLGRIELTQDIVALPADIIIPILLFLWLIWALGVKRKLPLPPSSSFILLFFLWATISLGFGARYLAGNQTIVSGLFLLRAIEYTGLYFVSWYIITQEPQFKKTLVRFLFGIGIVVALLGFFQLAIIPDFTELALKGGWDPHQGRILSTFFDPNFVGGFFAFNLFLGTSLFLEEKNPLTKIILVSTIAVLFIALLLTFSRSSYLAFLVGSFVIGLLRSKRLFLTLILFFAISVLFIPRIQSRIIGAINIDETSKTRITSWKRASVVVADHPIFGVGFNSYLFAQERYGFINFEKPPTHGSSGVDSSLLLVLVTTGFVGLIIYLGIWTGFLLKAWRFKNKPLGLATLSIIIALAVHSQFVNSLFFPQIMGWIFPLIGVFIGEKDENY